MSETKEELMSIPTDKLSVEMVDRMAEFQFVQRQAKMLLSSDLLPKWHQGKLANVVVIYQIAKRTGMEPLTVAQNMYLIQGKPTWSSPFLIALVRASKLYKTLKFVMTDGPEINFKKGDREWKGPDRICKLVATDHQGDVVEGPEVSLSIAIAEGWMTKEGSKWVTMPDLMLRYRAAAFFARTVCPEVVFGFYSQEEMEEIIDVEEAKPEDRKPRMNP